MNRPQKIARTLVPAALMAWAFSLTACAGLSTDAARQNIASNAQVHLKEGRLSAEEIERINRAYADRYIMRISTACDQVIDGNPDPVQCRKARDLRAGAATNIYDIVTDPDPYMQTLNLTVVVTLQSVAWVDEDVSQKVFADRGDKVKQAIREAHTEVLDIAGKVFSPEELKTLDDLIRAWRKKNPDLQHLSHARIADFLDSAEWEANTKAEATGLFAEIQNARQSVDEVRELAERALYFSKRMPLLLAWQTETTLDSLMANPPVARALDDFHNVSTITDRLPAILDAQRKGLVDDVERERKAIFADLDQHEPAIDASVKNFGTSAAQADALALDAKAVLQELQTSSVALRELFQQWDTSFGRMIPSAAAPTPAGNGGGTGAEAAAIPAGAGAASPTTPVRSDSVGLPTASANATQPSGDQGAKPHPFDIRDYTAALKEASEMARDLNTTLASTDKLLVSPVWQERVDEINTAADGRMRLATKSSQELVQSVFQKVYIALGGLLIVLVLSRFISAWLLKLTRLHKNIPPADQRS